MRTMSLNILYKLKFKVFDFIGEWLNVFGTPERAGIWIIYGQEKNGKTWFALKLAEYLSGFIKTLYISGEEGLSYGFVQACKRAQMETTKNIQFSDYINVGDLEARLAKQRAPGVVIVDNITVYNDELKNGKLRQLTKKHPNTLFIFIAHEEQGQPYTSTAKVAKKLANIIVHVEGLRATISGRCPGGFLYVDEAKAKIMWGEPAPQNISKTQKAKA
jgi:predicted ATP-dependent serine protease